MNVLYEEEGHFKVGAIIADQTSSLQVEAPHGKRSKVKATAVLLRFNEPPLGEFLPRAEQIAAEADVDFLWEAGGVEEFGFETLAQDYFGHAPTPLEQAGILLRLHGAPIYFYKKGRGRYKPAPPEALKAAQAAVERKRLQAEQQARYMEQLARFTLPTEFQPQLSALLYKPDRNTLECKALEAACEALHLSPLRLLEKCGAIASTHDYHLNRFLFEYFPRGTGFADYGPIAQPGDLPLAEVCAFSIDDAATTEIDDAFSVVFGADGRWRVGIHIAAPALGCVAGSSLDEAARARMSTVYMPGGKITMLPEAVIERFTLREGLEQPVLSLYLDVDPADFSVAAGETRLERVRIASNLRIDTLEAEFNETALAEGTGDYAYKRELTALWQLAVALEAARGKAESVGSERVDYAFQVEGEHIAITPRKRGSPIDKVVSELMIYANATWGGQLAEANIAGIYRCQQNGKVRMSTQPAPHQGLGVAQYAWSSSPLRRYVDLINQRQLIAQITGAAPPHQRDNDLFTLMTEFDGLYDAYAEFQRNMERYWCLRYLLQEKVHEVTGKVLRENLVRFDSLPLVCRVPGLPALPNGTGVALKIRDIDLLELGLSCGFDHALEGGDDTQLTGDADETESDAGATISVG